MQCYSFLVRSTRIYLNEESKVTFVEQSGKSMRNLVLALLAVYIVWGSTYLAIRIAVGGLPPLLMGGIRFLVAGSILFTVLRLRGAPLPTAKEWRSAALVGLLLLVGGNGGVVIAEQWIDSSMAAMVIATTPVWAAVFGGLWGSWPRRVEWIGMVFGLLGVVILSANSRLSASPLGIVLLLFATASWSLGTVWSRHLTMPQGLMSSAAQMLPGGAIMIALGLMRGERITTLPSTSSLLALGYLIIFGSLVAFSAYVYLMNHARPALVTSYSYVNPIVAVLLGATIGEPITSVALLALALIVAGVMMVVVGGARTRTKQPSATPQIHTTPSLQEK